MRAPSFGGAMRPGSDGRCLLDVRHRVEVRCGREQRSDGHWIDAWRNVTPQGGVGYDNAELAHQHADTLRRGGAVVRVRPVIV